MHDKAACLVTNKSSRGLRTATLHADSNNSHQPSHGSHGLIKPTWEFCFQWVPLTDTMGSCTVTPAASLQKQEEISIPPAPTRLPMSRMKNMRSDKGHCVNRSMSRSNLDKQKSQLPAHFSLAKKIVRGGKNLNGWFNSYVHVYFEYIRASFKQKPLMGEEEKITRKREKWTPQNPETTYLFFA